jgi:hypothetical protein
VFLLAEVGACMKEALDAYDAWMAEPGRDPNNYLLAEGTRDQLPEQYDRRPSYWDGDDTPEYPWPKHTWGDGSVSENEQ